MWFQFGVSCLGFTSVLHSWGMCHGGMGHVVWVVWYGSSAWAMWYESCGVCVRLYRPCGMGHVTWVIEYGSQGMCRWVWAMC